MLVPSTKSRRNDDLKSRELASIDLELLQLRRSTLEENKTAFLEEAGASRTREIANVRAELVGRGLSNSTLLTTRTRAVEKEWAIKVERALQEHDRALEELALYERKVRAQQPPWTRILPQ